MEIVFTEDSTINEINKQFQAHYPFLRIQFYEDKFDPQKKTEAPGSPVKNDNMSIHDILHGRVKGSISMNGHTKVKNFESNWMELAGLWIQVFRKSGPVWLQTTVTDEMTLAEINRMGEEMSQPIPPSEPDDIHEQA